MDVDSVVAVLAALEREQVAYIVVGGVALNLLGIPRATVDLDLFVHTADANIQRLRTALKSVFHDDDIDQITAEDLRGDFPAVQYVPPDGHFHIDILARLGEAFSYDDLEVEIVNFQGVRVPVVTAATLYRMKKNTVRLRDKADAERLERRFKLQDD